MKRLSVPRACSGFLVTFLMLVSLAAGAARLEVDRNEMAVGGDHHGAPERRTADRGGD